MLLHASMPSRLNLPTWPVYSYEYSNCINSKCQQIARQCLLLRLTTPASSVLLHGCTIVGFVAKSGNHVNHSRHTYGNIISLLGESNALQHCPSMGKIFEICEKRE